jgi:hypothetical protein
MEKVILLHGGIRKAWPLGAFAYLCACHTNGQEWECLPKIQRIK